MPPKSERCSNFPSKTNKKDATLPSKNNFTTKLSQETLNNALRSICGCCLDPVEEIGERSRRGLAFIDTCKHPFHYDCIYKWSRYETSCPQCKLLFSKIAKYDVSTGQQSFLKTCTAVFQADLSSTSESESEWEEEATPVIATAPRRSAPAEGRPAGSRKILPRRASPSASTRRPLPRRLPPTHAIAFKPESKSFESNDSDSSLERLEKDRTTISTFRSRERQNARRSKQRLDPETAKKRTERLLARLPYYANFLVKESYPVFSEQLNSPSTKAASTSPVQLSTSASIESKGSFIFRFARGTASREDTTSSTFSKTSTTPSEVPALPVKATQKFQPRRSMKRVYIPSLPLLKATRFSIGTSDTESREGKLDKPTAMTVPTSKKEKHSDSLQRKSFACSAAVQRRKFGPSLLLNPTYEEDFLLKKKE